MNRQERTGIEFPGATWTSSDRYDRYGAIARCLRASLGEGRHRVLDVGDAAGYLRLFAGDLRLVGVDLAVQPDRLDLLEPLVADGARLPFADRTFAAVVSSDVLEHVPADRRAAFLAELSRVSDDLVIVAAPFDTEGVAGVEELIRRFVVVTTGRPQEQLDEHMEHGLPDLPAAVEALSTHGEVTTIGNGNLWDWLELMLVKHQLLARPALQPFHDGIDILCNQSLAGRAQEPPFYRHLIAARRSAPVAVGEPPVPPTSAARAASLLASLLAAAGPESTRQDVVPTLESLAAELPRRGELHELVQQLHTSLAAVMDRLTAVEVELERVRSQGDRVASILDRLGRPLRAVKRSGRDGEG